MKIIVNGSEVVVTQPKLSYADVVQLGGKPHGPMYTMTYSRAADDRDGTMISGDEVEAVDGTVFSFVVTDNA